MISAIKTAEILCVGTELLLGDIINTNASTISRCLASLGIHVYHQSVVGDHPGRLASALELALSRSDLVITSGGLGPTYDDLTRETVAAALGLSLAQDDAVLFEIQGYFARTGRQMTPNNARQAMVPAGATVLHNARGTAPGLIVPSPDGQKTVILLPGPPSELIPMLEAQVVPYLKTRTQGVLVSHNIHIFGMGESTVEHILKELMTEATNPTVAPYCKTGEVRLRVTASAPTETEADELCRQMVAKIRESSVGPHIYAVVKGGEMAMEQVALETLLTHGLTVATAESCTGGLIAKRLTDIPGASSAVLGGFVTYTNEMKIKLLGVSEETLNIYTEYSVETAMEMARGARERTGADIGVSTTGVCGPGGGSEHCPVGRVYVGISTANGERGMTLTLSPDRSRDYLRTLAATHALHAVWQEANAWTKK